LHAYILTHLLTYSHSYLLTTYIITYLLANNVLTYLICLLTYMLTYLLTHLLTYLHTYLFTYLLLTVYRTQPPPTNSPWNFRKFEYHIDWFIFRNEKVVQMMDFDTLASLYVGIL